jgi:transcriptional regulator with XRE-family HTH domain
MTITPTEKGSHNISVGPRIAELRKRKGLSQSDLASRLSRRRTQAWVSNVESGRHSVKHGDLFEITAILETTLSGFFSYLSQSPGPTSKSLSDMLADLDRRLPIEMPVYLQSDLGDGDPEPIDYHYGSSVPGKSVFNSGHPMAQSGDLSVMVVERHYNLPKMDPTDLVTYSGAILPVPDPDDRIAERVLVSVNEPLAGLWVHPALCKAPGEVKIALSRQRAVVLTSDAYSLLGVIVDKRTLYRSSVIRTWIQRRHGIIKEKLLTEQIIACS